MNRCVRFTKIKIGALQEVELKALPTAQSSLLCEYAEDCLFLYVDDADEFIKCLVRAVYYNKTISNVTTIMNQSDHEILWNIANSGCKIHENSFGLWMNELNAFRYANMFRAKHHKYGVISVNDLTNAPGYHDDIYQYEDGILLRRKDIGGIYLWSVLAPFEPETILDTDIYVGLSAHNSDKIVLIDNLKRNPCMVEEYFNVHPISNTDGQ